ncbi:hypothetical protein MQA28_26315 [Escherichia coli]|nr:hypothetical protein [Escherichia coli]
MKLLLLLGLVAGLAVAQHSHGMAHLVDYIDSLVLERLHNWRLEDHHGGDVHFLLFINDMPQQKYCYVIVVSHTWDYLVQDHSSVDRIANEILNMIEDPNHIEAPLHPGELADRFQDWVAARECRGHATYQVFYTPSFLEDVTEPVTDVK